MRFTPDFLDEIRARLPVSEVVGARVKLKKQGREWRGLSPFQQEKTPSFYVNDQKGFYHDFSSGKHGNVFDFIMETEGLSFPESVERLAAQAGLALPAQTRESAEAEKRRATLNEVLEISAAFFEAQLQARIGAKARGYLADRGLAPATQQKFRLGYAPPEKFALRDALAAKGASAETMIEAGMLIHGEDIAVPYDRFRDRVMFPICDRAGRVIAFGGRAMDKEAAAKYLNSPETPLFHKGSVLYNHHNARKASHEKGTLIAVEGYVDVISMTMAGFPQVVAPLGTALGAEQCELMWKMAEAPILCFDGDKAGRKAAYRAIDTALPLLGPEKTLRIALLPEGQDPDDLARSGGAGAVQAVLNAARPLADVLWTRETEAAQPLDTPERKAALERRVRDLLKNITDETLRRHYQDDMQARLDSLFGRGQRQQNANRPQGRWTLPQKFKRWRDERDMQGGASVPPQIGASLARSGLFAAGQVKAPPREAMILIMMLNRPDMLARHAEELSGLEFFGRDHIRLRNCMVALAAEPISSPEGMAQAVDAAGLGEVRRKLDSAATLPSLWCISASAAEADAEQVLRQALTLHRRTHALHQGLKSAELACLDETLGDVERELAFARIRDIKEQLAAIEGMEATIEGFGLMSGRQAAEV